MLGFESRPKQKEDLTTELEYDASFSLGDIITTIKKVIYCMNVENFLLKRMLIIT